MSHRSAVAYRIHPRRNMLRYILIKISNIKLKEKWKGKINK